ncbi:hypothetical protein SAMN06269185_2858 [Natronoarchaeum philippinense]|uniref:ThuA-like domain-containing protein n=1 Tax=Natronoarchaeum philippinense TaxID=558529 RepID=A0A285P5M0_NATPI|nr:ThuA domain-containing protein [Natronoarchaeum philippinense]SNZ17032.1 hypothetical protein SAMN06269185_2858 [Natronoarchaeum philippinense]
MANDLSVLIIGGNRFPFHRFDRVGPQLADALNEHGIETTLTTDRDELSALNEYDVVLDYMTDSTLEEKQLDGLLTFVETGGGYVGLHCAADLSSTASDDPDELIDAREEPVPELRELLGGYFHTHPAQTTFDVRVTDSHHPVTAGMEDVTVWDEPYDVSVDSDDVRVLARMDHPDLGDTPVVWVRKHGDGRVCYCSLGHTDAALSDGGVQQLLRRGVGWAGGAD